MAQLGITRPSPDHTNLNLPSIYIHHSITKRCSLNKSLLDFPLQTLLLPRASQPPLFICKIYIRPGPASNRFSCPNIRTTKKKKTYLLSVGRVTVFGFSPWKQRRWLRFCPAISSWAKLCDSSDMEHENSADFYARKFVVVANIDFQPIYVACRAQMSFECRFELKDESKLSLLLLLLLVDGRQFVKLNLFANYLRFECERTWIYIGP